MQQGVDYKETIDYFNYSNNYDSVKILLSSFEQGIESPYRNAQQ